MTKEEMTARITQEQARVLDALAGTDPQIEAEKYARILENLRQLNWMATDYLCPAGDLKAMEECAEQLEEEKQSAAQTEFIYTKEAVREILTDASKKGVKIKSLISKHIPEGAKVGFSSVPSSEYEAVVAEVNECLNAMPF